MNRILGKGLLNKKNLVTSIKDTSLPVQVVAAITKANPLKIRSLRQQNGGWESWLQNEVKWELEQQVPKFPKFGPGYRVIGEMPVWNLSAGKGTGTGGDDAIDKLKASAGRVDALIVPNEDIEPIRGKELNSTLIELKVAYQSYKGLGTIDGKLEWEYVPLKKRFLEDIAKRKVGLNKRGLDLTFGTTRDVVVVGVEFDAKELEGEWGEYGNDIKYTEVKEDNGEPLCWILFYETTLEKVVMTRH